MRDSSTGGNDRGNMERMGESAGALAGRAADFGMEVTGALFRSAAQMLGGWWSSDAPQQAAGSWSNAEDRCRNHYQSSARGASGTSGSTGSTTASGSTGGAAGGMHASGSVGGVSGSVSVGGSTGGADDATNVAPKSSRGAMQTAGQMTTATDGSGAFETSGAAQIGDTRVEGSMSMDSATDGFESARPGYQFGYVARQNPAYKGRSFSEVEPELRKVWESRAQTQGSAYGSSSSWPEVRGYVDFAYQQGGDTDR